jgi:hypothetical protein
MKTHSKQSSVQIQQKPKIGKNKEPYVGKPMPTENNLVTEEAPLSTSFHFYGSGTQEARGKRSNRYIAALQDTETRDEDIIEILSQKQANTTHNNQQKPKQIAAHKISRKIYPEEAPMPTEVVC